MKNSIYRFLILLFGLTSSFVINSCNKAEEDDSKYSGDLFREHIRSTDPLTPEEERLGFKLPPRI